MIVALGGIYVLFTEQDAAKAIEVASQTLDKASEAISEIDGMTSFFDSFDRLAATYRMGLTLRSAVEQSCVTSLATDTLVSSMFELVARPLAVACDFEQSDQWTIGVYKAVPAAEPNRAELRCIAQKRAIECTVDEARVWPEGVGIAGLAYSNAREVVIPDMSVEGMKAVFGPRAMRRTYDNERYVSMVAVPIIVPGLDKPWGVVNATSDRSGHFSAASDPGFKTDEPLRSFAAFIGLAVAVREGLDRSGRSSALVTNNDASASSPREEPQS